MVPWLQNYGTMRLAVLQGRKTNLSMYVILVLVLSLLVPQLDKVSCYCVLLCLALWAGTFAKEPCQFMRAS